MIDLIVRDSTIRYIFDAQHLNIIHIILYFDIFPFFENFFLYNIISILLISLHCTAGHSCCLFFTYLQYICLSKD